MLLSLPLPGLLLPLLTSLLLLFPLTLWYPRILAVCPPLFLLPLSLYLSLCCKLPWVASVDTVLLTPRACVQNTSETLLCYLFS